jgi:Family of unknown function (DUF6786)
MSPAENELVNVLSDVGKAPVQQVHPDGSRLVLLPYGARVLGLFAPGSDENFLWVHPALASTASAEAFFRSGDWHNTGGDRTWLAPEVDVFFPQYPDTAVWKVPRELDPGAYQVIEESPTIKLAAKVAVTLSRSQEKVRARITKHWSPAPNPLRYEPIWTALGDITYAGYTQETCLEMLPGSDGAASIALWNLVCVPNGGEVLIPTHTRAEPEIYWGTIKATDLKVTNHLVRFRTGGAGIQKIGVRACASTGRLGYLHESDDAWTLIVRNFRVNPSGEYIDVPGQRSTAPDAMGFSTQACNVQTGDWDYCELEHHFPAVSFALGQTLSVDTSQIWAFRGPQDAVETVARSLLGSEA